MAACRASIRTLDACARTLVSSRTAGARQVRTANVQPGCRSAPELQVALNRSAGAKEGEKVATLAQAGRQGLGFHLSSVDSVLLGRHPVGDGRVLENNKAKASRPPCHPVI